MEVKKKKTLKGFRSEAALVRSFISFLNRSGLPKDTSRVLEFEAGHGVADIVLFRRKNLKKGGLANFSRLPPRFAFLLGSARLPEVFSESVFSILAGTSEKASASALSRLARIGVLRKLPSGEYRRDNSIACPVETIVSIEAKLNKWQHAHRQAFRYREFSHQSWVLLDAAKASRAIESMSLFVRTNVGLATIDSSGRVSIHHEPGVTSPFSETRFWAESVRLIRRSRAVR